MVFRRYRHSCLPYAPPDRQTQQATLRLGTGRPHRTLTKVPFGTGASLQQAEAVGGERALSETLSEETTALTQAEGFGTPGLYSYDSLRNYAGNALAKQLLSTT